MTEAVEGDLLVLRLRAKAGFIEGVVAHGNLAYAQQDDANALTEAADEIERLRAALSRAEAEREALRLLVDFPANHIAQYGESAHLRGEDERGNDLLRIAQEIREHVSSRLSRTD